MRIKATVNVKRLGTSGSTSGRGARALYLDDAPRDFGPKVALHASFQIPVQDQSIRQGGREMSAPRPYVTDPFLTTSYVPFDLTKSSISVYIQLTSYFLSHLVSALVAQCTHAYLLNEKTGVVRLSRRALCDEECQRMTCRNQDGGEFDFLASTIEISFLF